MSTWWKWVERQLDERGLTRADLIRDTGIDHTRVSRWATGKGGVGVDAVRTVCEYLDRPIWSGLVAAGILLPHEVPGGLPEPVSLRDFSADELGREVARRLAELELLGESSEGS